MTADTTPSLRVEDLVVTYRTRLRAGAGGPRGLADLAVGSRLGLAGESGCGKSSLASAILRLLPKSASVSGASCSAARTC